MERTIAQKVALAQHMVARINSMGDDKQSGNRFGYARRCAIVAHELLQEVLDELARQDP